MKLPRILLLYTGGTFGMDIEQHPSKNITLSIPNLSSEHLKKRLLQHVPELNRLAQCDVDVILNRDSSQMSPSEWLLMAQTIQKKWKNYEGVVVIHGTDTLAYTASALSFLLRPCLKPVVITGAQRPVTALRTDARTNLIAAIEVVVRGPSPLMKQVTVLFGDRLFQGNRVRKRSAADFAAFESPHALPLAQIGTSIRYHMPSVKTASPRSTQARLQPQFSQKILVVHVTPGFHAQSIQTLLDRLDALILVIYQSGTAPTHDPHFIALLDATHAMKLPVILVTETSTLPPGPKPESILYCAGKELLARGCLSAATLTLECAFVKTALILGQTLKPKSFVQLWKENFANEGSVEK